MLASSSAAGRIPTIVARDVSLLPKLKPKKNKQPSAVAIRNQLDKLERDERMDIARCMTPPKTYMGGFTRPKAFKIFDHLPGGKYATREKSYPVPVDEAYQSYTVYILESREVQPGRCGIDTKDGDLHIVGVCPERDFEAIVRRRNEVLVNREAADEEKKTPVPGHVPKPRTMKRKERRALKKKNKAEMKLVRLRKEKERRKMDREQPAHMGPPKEEQQPFAALRTSPPELLVDKFAAPAFPRTSAPRYHKYDEREAESRWTPGLRREMHTSPVLSATAVDGAVPAMELDVSEEHEINEDEEHESSLEPTPDPTDSTYTPTRELKKLPKFSETPHWRPLLTLTTFSRPLADTIERMCKASPRGMPYHAQISKCSPGEPLPRFSYASRIRCLRAERILQLGVTAAELMLGARGGMVGMRLGAGDLGRGLDGLEGPVPYGKRAIRVGVGEWYERAEEVREAWEMEGGEVVKKYGGGEGEAPFVLERLDEWGRRIVDGGELKPFWEGAEEAARLKAERERLKAEMMEGRVAEGVEDPSLEESMVTEGVEDSSAVDLSMPSTKPVPMRDTLGVD